MQPDFKISSSLKSNEQLCHDLFFELKILKDSNNHLIVELDSNVICSTGNQISKKSYH